MFICVYFKFGLKFGLRRNLRFLLMSGAFKEESESKESYNSVKRHAMEATELLAQSKFFFIYFIYSDSDSVISVSDFGLFAIPCKAGINKSYSAVMLC